MLVLKIIGVVCWSVLFLAYASGVGKPTMFTSILMSLSLIFNAIGDLLQ